MSVTKFNPIMKRQYYGILVIVPFVFFVSYILMILMSILINSLGITGIILTHNMIIGIAAVLTIVVALLSCKPCRIDKRYTIKKRNELSLGNHD